MTVKGHELEAMMTRYDGLVTACVRQLSPAHMRDDDAIQAGRLGLWEACLTWDRRRSFAPYARACIRHNVLDYLKGRRPDPDPIPDDWTEDEDTGDDLTASELAAIVRRFPAAHRRERQVLLLLLEGKGKTEIARRLGTSRRTVQRLAVRGWALVEAAKEEQGG